MTGRGRISSIFLIGCTAVFLLPARLAAQEEPAPWEAGVHFTAVQLTDHSRADIGGGVRIGRNLTRYLGLEGEVNFFGRDLKREQGVCSPDSRFCSRAPTLPVFTDRRIQGLFGVKAGLRAGRFGFFGKMRPGFYHFRNRFEVVCVAAPCPPLESGKSQFALDFGGILEFYTSRRLALRLDAGDTYVHGTGVDAVPLAGPLGHNFQLQAGVSFRFGN